MLKDCGISGIEEKGSLEEARLITYIQDYNEGFFTTERPCILIMPGGGYTNLAKQKEGEVYALQMCAMGYHAAVLEYSVSPACYPTQILREHAAEWHINPDRIFVCGSSAGGHLAASYGLGMADWTTQGKDCLGIEPACQSWIKLLRVWLEHF